MTFMQYKGYLGRAEIDTDADVLSGEVIGTRDVITFQAKPPRKLVKALHESVDDYLDFCASRGEQPDKPLSGKFMVRTDPETHRAFSLAAEREGESLNAWINAHLRPAAEDLLESRAMQAAKAKKPGVGDERNSSARHEAKQSRKQRPRRSRAQSSRHLG